MFKNTTAICCFGLLSVMAVTAQAQLQSLEAQVAYSALRVFSNDEIRMESVYHYTPGKHRTEMRIEGQSMTAIIREDLDVMWSLAPTQSPMKVYMEFSMDSSEVRSANAMAGSEVTASRLVGAEKVGGYRTDKYEITVREAEGVTFTGHAWMTSEMIPVRMEMLDQRGGRLVLEQSNIEIGPQPDELFEVPAGYTKLDLGGFGAAFGDIARGLGKGSDTQDDTDDADQSGLTREIAGHATKAAKQGVLHGVSHGVRDQVGRRIRGLFNRD
jgi:hypothetical protein